MNDRFHFHPVSDCVDVMLIFLLISLMPMSSLPNRTLFLYMCFLFFMFLFMGYMQIQYIPLSDAYRYYTAPRHDAVQYAAAPQSAPTRHHAAPQISAIHKSDGVFAAFPLSYEREKFPYFWSLASYHHL